MKKVIFLIIAAFMLLLADSARAQDPIFRNYSSLEYQGQTQNWDIEELPGGRVAFANNAGLILYDGDRWSSYPMRNYTVCRALRYDSAQGRLYVGATGEFGYYRINDLTHSLDYHSLSDLLPKSDRHFGEIWKILIINGGKDNEEVVFQSKSHIFIYTHKGYARTIRTADRIETIGAWNGRIVAATRHFICEVRGARLVPLAGASLADGIVVRYLGPFEGRLLVATQSNGLFAYDGKSIAPFAADLLPQLRRSQVFSISIRGSKMAIGTVRDGLIAKDFKDGTVFYVNSSQGLQNNTVLSLNITERGCVWMGLDNGISFVIPDMPYRNIVSQRYNVGTGYTALADGSTLYLGTNQGLFVRRLPLSQQLMASQPQSVDGIGSQVWHLSKVGSTVFCGTDRGLYTISGTRAARVDGVDGTWTVLPLKSHKGYMLVNDYLGMALLRMDGPSPRFVRRIKIPVDVSGNIYEDSDGTLWMSLWQQGIYHLQLSPDMTSVRVLALYNKDNGLVVNEGNQLCRVGGRVYISSVDGFYRYDPRLRRLVYDKSLSQIFSTYGTSLRLIETPSGDIWAQKNGYLAIAHRTRRGFAVDSVSYRPIVESRQVMVGELSTLSAEQTLVNSTDGFFLTSNHIRGTRIDYPLYISRIISTNNGDSIVYQTLAYNAAQKEIRLPHSLNSIRVEFALPEYRVSDAVDYQCCLENYDTHWSQTSTSKEYTRLSRGKYTLRVRAYNRLSGKTQETAIVIQVLPAWYETTLARIVYILLVCCALWMLVRWLKWRAGRELLRESRRNARRMHEQQMELEAEQSKRRAQAAEMQAERLQNELKHKSSELASSTMNLIHQNDILQQLDEEMNSLSEAVRRDERKPQVTRQIQQIRSAMQSYLNDDGDWDKFEENFNVVYDDFMVSLTRQFPLLKKSDRKLCAYLKMGLSSKEMASLLNMSVRSVETARYRLRKKLQLGAGDNLTGFIQNFGKK